MDSNTAVLNEIQIERSMWLEFLEFGGSVLRDVVMKWTA
jgi:hypothetical protein